AHQARVGSGGGGAPRARRHRGVQQGRAGGRRRAGRGDASGGQYRAGWLAAVYELFDPVRDCVDAAAGRHDRRHHFGETGLVITPTHYMLLSAALFIIGVVGVMVRRNIIIIFMSIELILNAVNINLVALSKQLQNDIGQVFAIFVIAVAAAEAAVGLGIILAFYRNKETVNIDEMNLMKW